MSIRVRIIFMGFLLFLGITLKAQETLIKRSPKQLYNQALDLYEQKNYGSALELLDQYLKASRSGGGITAEDASFYAADCAVKLKEGDALYRLTSFSDHYSSSAWIPVVNWLMGDLYFQKGRYYLALEIFNKIDPSHLNKKQKAQFEYEKGFCLLKMKKTSVAIPYFNDAMQSKTVYAKPARYYHAFILYQNGQYDQALKDFLEVKDDPEYKRQVPALILQTYYELGQYEKVVELGKSFLPEADYRLKPVVNRLIANALYKQKKYADALPYFSAYVTHARTSISDDEYYRMGLAQFNAEKYNESVSSLQRITTGPESVMKQSAWYYLGSAYYKLKEYRFAQNAWVSAYQSKADAELTAQSLFAYINLTLKEKGDPYRNPVNLVEDFIHSSGATAEQKEQASRFLVQLYMSSNNKQMAIASIEKNPNPGRVLQQAYQQLTYQQAIALYQGRQYRDAILYFNKALRFTPDYDLQLNTLFWMANTEYWLRAYSQAVQSYKKFLISRGATASALYTKAYYGLGYAYFNEKKYSQAIEFFQRYLSRERTNKDWINDAELRIADSYVMLQDYTKALTYYNRVIRTGRSDAPYALYQKAYCYGVQGDFQSKVSTLKSLISSYPASEYYGNAIYDMADTYSSALNSPRQAIVYFNQLVNERPGTSFARKALVKMGLLYYKNNQNAQAISVLKKVIASYPATEEARVALSTLESIYKDQGNLSQYFAYAKTLSFVQVSHSQEDSLTFSVGEDAYLNGNCNKVISSLKSYLSQFPQGGFRLKAYNYLSECYAKRNDTVQAIHYYNKIIDFPQNDYTLSALIRAARMEYARKSYHDAYNDYHKLLPLTENASLRLEALDGSMRSAYLLQNMGAASDVANELLQTKGASEDQLVFAHFVLAKAAFVQGDLKKAMTEFEITSRLSKGAPGAESMYEMAQLDFNSKKYPEAEKVLFSLSDRYPNEVYWVAKGFILLADTYAARGNVFQARETLKSVLNNYPGNDLKKIAREKLALLPQEKKSNEKK
ncbi:MAG: tetratricopeptide repeat protein [Bacteroidales bacterium]|nr:tetratricopeptide repeat protein [Bacteroidales bacterium]